jgi:hypothetical protein
MKIATGAVITCLLLQFCTATAAPSIASDTAEQSLDQVRLLYEQGKYQSALPIALDTLAKAKKKFGPGSLETAPVLHELGRIEQTIADFKQSEVHHLQALAIQEKTQLARSSLHDYRQVQRSRSNTEPGVGDF